MRTTLECNAFHRPWTVVYLAIHMTIPRSSEEIVTEAFNTRWNLDFFDLCTKKSCISNGLKTRSRLEFNTRKFATNHLICSYSIIVHSKALRANVFHACWNHDLCNATARKGPISDNLEARTSFECNRSQRTARFDKARVRLIFIIIAINIIDNSKMYIWATFPLRFLIFDHKSFSRSF